MVEMAKNRKTEKNRFFCVGFRFFSVFEKPTSVSVSVFQKTSVFGRFSVNRLNTSL